MTATLASTESKGSTTDRKDNKSLIGYVVDSVIAAGVPLTRTAVTDLLATTPYLALRKMTDSGRLFLADKFGPSDLAYSSFDSPVYDLADKVVIIEDEEFTVAAAARIYPIDFVLACYSMPDTIARFYVMVHLSQTGTIWPSGGADDLKVVPTKFNLGYLDREVKSYLNKPADYNEWCGIFGLTGMVKTDDLADKSNHQVIALLKQDVLTATPDRRRIIDSHAATTLEKAGAYYGVKSGFVHYDEACGVMWSLGGVVDAIKRYKTDPDMFASVIKEMVSP